MVGRYGGEEFLMLLPSTTQTEALIAAERVRDHCARFSHLLEDGKNLVVTCSIGVAAFSDEITDHTELLQRSDEALYMAKKSGRNQIQLWCKPHPTSAAGDGPVEK